MSRSGPHHAGPVALAAAEDRSTYRFTSVPKGIKAMLSAVAAALGEAAAGKHLRFVTVRLADDRVVGWTRFSELVPWVWPTGGPLQRSNLPDAVEIGHTFLAASAQRGAVNTEAKLLMLAHALTRGVSTVCDSGPTPGTAAPGPPSSGSGRPSKECCGPTGRAPMTRYATRPVIRSWPTNGPRSEAAWSPVSPSDATTGVAALGRGPHRERGRGEIQGGGRGVDLPRGGAGGQVVGRAQVLRPGIPVVVLDVARGPG